MQFTSVSPFGHCILGATGPGAGWRQRPSLEEIRAFILDWYRCIDEHAPVALLISRLAKMDLVLKFPDQTIQSAVAFRDWYAKWCSPGLTVKHEVSELQISWDRAAGYGAECIVHQRLTESNGKVKNQLLKAHWHLRVSALGAIEVTRCVVTRLN